jgi:hypothetical protein
MQPRSSIRWRLATIIATILPLALFGIALAQPPGFPRMPNIPRPPIGPRGPGMGLEVSKTYKCSKCGTVSTISKPINDPDQEAHCLKCGARLDAPDNAPPPDNRNPNEDAENRNRPGILNPGPQNNDPPPNTPVIDFSKPATTSSAPVATSSKRTTWIIVIVVVGGVLLLLAAAGIGAIIWMVSTAPSASGGRRVRRSRRPTSQYDPV